MKSVTAPKRKDAAPARLRVALYARVSTEEQATSGYSINGQLEKLQLACKLYNWDPVPAYVDEGYSGKNLDRPHVKRLIQDARAKRFDLVVVYKLDRLSRRLSDLLTLRDEFELAQVGIRSATEPFDTTNSAGKLLFNMLGSFAQFEREMIVERTKMGLARRMKEGKWNGLAPFGYRIKEGGTLEIHPEELPFARKVFDLYLRDNIGSKAIARYMRQEDHCTRRKGAWARNSVWNMLTNPVYAGLYRIDGELTKGPHKGIITPEMFEQIQTTLAGKSPVNARVQLSPNVLIGLIKCGHCGSVMTTGKGKGHHYYACSGRIGDRGCAMQWIPARPIEEAVVREIKLIASMPDLIEQCIADLQTENEGEIKLLRSEQTSLEKQLQGLEKTKDKKLQWMLETLPDGAVAEEIRREIQKQLDSIKVIKHRHQEIALRMEALNADKVRADVIADFLKCFGEDFVNLEAGQRRVLIQGLVQNVVVNSKDDCEVILTIPVSAAVRASQNAKKGGPLDEDRPQVHPWMSPTRPVVHLSAPNGVTEGT